MVEALPSGVGEVANRGCLCHGCESAEVEVSAYGFPEVYNTSEIYNISILQCLIVSKIRSEAPEILQDPHTINNVSPAAFLKKFFFEFFIR